MIIRTTAQRPVEKAVSLFDAQIVDARVSMMHNSFCIELPILVAVGSVPLRRIVVKLIGESHCNPIAVKRPEFLQRDFDFVCCNVTVLLVVRAAGARLKRRLYYT